MKRRKWADIRRAGSAGDVAPGVAMRQAIDDALALGQLREARGTTQNDLAGRLGIGQSNVSRLERREDLYLSTLREYVAALDGELFLVARFPDGQEVQLEPSGEPVARERPVVVA